MNAIVDIVDCKRCFTCKRNYPLFLYHVNDSKYQREADKGVTIECRICTLKRAKNDKGLMQRINGKFEFVPMNKIEIIKYILKR
jgi:hypothetical protein